MISSGVDAFLAFDSDREEPEALVFEIIHRALLIADRNRRIRSGVPVELSLPSGSRLVRLSGSE
jgi:hypothetical protein